MTPRAKRLLASATLLAAAAGVVAYLADGNDEPLSTPPLVRRPLAPSTLPRHVVDPVAAFAVIAERPLLSPSRRPAPPPAPPAPVVTPVAPPPPVPPPGTLLAVLIAPGRRTAVLRLGDGHTATLAEGEVSGGWILEEVRPDRVLLRSGGTRAEVAFPMHRVTQAAATRIASDSPAAPSRRRR